MPAIPVACGVGELAGSRRRVRTLSLRQNLSLAAITVFNGGTILSFRTIAVHNNHTQLFCNVSSAVKGVKAIGPISSCGIVVILN